MTTETKTEGAGDGSDDGASRGRHDEHLTQAQRQRDAAKERARKLEAERDDLAQRLALLEGEKAERDDEIARKAGDFSKVEDGYKRTIESLTKKTAEYEQREAARIRRDRQGAFAEAVRQKTGIADVAIVRGLLRDAADDGALDDAPEEMNEDAVAEAVRHLQSRAPTLFTTRNTPRVPAGAGAPDVQVPEKYANDPSQRAAYLRAVALSTPRR